MVAKITLRLRARNARTSHKTSYLKKDLANLKKAKTSIKSLIAADKS